MKVYLNEISGIPDAIVSMHMSKRTRNEKLEKEIRDACSLALDRRGKINPNCPIDMLEKFDKWMNLLVKWGSQHITLLRYIDLSITVEGLHRGGQDDWDSHASRLL